MLNISTHFAEAAHYTKNLGYFIKSCWAAIKAIGSLKMLRLSKKQKICGFASGAILLLLGNTYGKWELLTLLRGKEVDFLLRANSNEWMLPPEFSRVVEYNDQRIVAFMVETGGQDMLVEFKKNSQGDWKLSRSAWCTVSGGTPGCFFPWYSLSGLRQAIEYGCSRSCLTP